MMCSLSLSAMRAGRVHSWHRSFFLALVPVVADVKVEGQNEREVADDR